MVAKRYNVQTSNDGRRGEVGMAQFSSEVCGCSKLDRKQIAPRGMAYYFEWHLNRRSASLQASPVAEFDK